MVPLSIVDADCDELSGAEALFVTAGARGARGRAWGRIGTDAGVAAVDDDDIEVEVAWDSEIASCVLIPLVRREFDRDPDFDP